MRLLVVSFFMLLAFGSARSAEIAPVATFRGTDHVAAGVGGLRGTGKGMIQLKGVRGTVQRALLYWHGPTNSDDPTANARLNFDGQNVQGTLIGFSDDNVWNQKNSQAYQADVTGLLRGDGTYRIGGLAKAHSNGASLIVFFDDGDQANDRDVLVYDGNDSNYPNDYDPPGWDIRLEGIGYRGGEAFIELHVSDGQNFGANDDGTLEINGRAAARGGIFQGRSVPQTRGSSIRNGGLWDIKRFDIAKDLASGDGNLRVTFQRRKDALSAIAVLISLPAGAAPMHIHGQPWFGVSHHSEH